MCVVVIWEMICDREIKKHNYELFLISISIILVIIASEIKTDISGAAPQSNLTLINADAFVKNIQNCFTGVFLLIRALPYSNGVSVFSIDGISYLLKLGLVFLVFIIPVFACLKCRILIRHRLSRFIISIMVINYAVLLVTQTNYGAPIFEDRYHIIWFTTVLTFLPFFADCILERAANNLFSKICIFTCIGCIIFLNVSGFYSCRNPQSIWYKESRQLIKIAEKEDVDGILIYDEWVRPSIIRALNEELYCFNVQMQDGEFSLQILDFYKDNRIDGSNLLLASEEEYNSLPENVKNAYVYIADFSEEKLYKTEQSPWLF